MAELYVSLEQNYLKLSCGRCIAIYRCINGGGGQHWVRIAKEDICNLKSHLGNYTIHNYQLPTTQPPPMEYILCIIEIEHIYILLRKDFIKLSLKLCLHVA